MEQNSGRIDPTPRPPRSPPASFSRVPVVPALGRTGKLGHIRLSRPDAGLGASPLPSLAVQPTLGAGHGPAGPNGPRPHPAPTRARVGRTPPPRDARTAEVPERVRIHRASSIAIPRLPDRNPQTPTTIQYPLPRRGNRLVTLGVAAASPRARRRVARTAYKSLNARLMLKLISTAWGRVGSTGVTVTQGCRPRRRGTRKTSGKNITGNRQYALAA